MLGLKQIEENYPENLRIFKKNILREYLQYKILEIIFASKFSGKLSFLGGTALRIIYGNTRFSEDLDFDNFNLSEKEFTELTNSVGAGLRKQGFEVEISQVFKGAYRCRVKLPKILFTNALSPLEEEKIMIQIDTAPHEFVYKVDGKILNKFDVFTEIFSTPADIILSQKIYAALNRKRAKGRDFYDIVFLLSFAKPNYQYLEKKMGIKNSEELKSAIVQAAAVIDFKELGRDVQPFLFNPSDAKKVERFAEFIAQAKLEKE